MAKKAPGQKRCPWGESGNEAYRRYHDEEWGAPVHDDRTLFEFLVLESAQAGLLEKIDSTGDYNEEIEQALHAAIKDFKANNTW